ncbi:hypothetical protein D3C72_67060 [compost metagenome]
MKLHLSMSAALCASFALVTAAQNAHAQNAPVQSVRPDPSDPAAATVAPAYQSAFQHYIVMPQQSSTPDKGWRAANDEMARLQGHSGHIRSDSGQAVPAMHQGHGMSHGSKE